MILRLAPNYINICFVRGLFIPLVCIKYVLSLWGFNGFGNVRQVYSVNPIGFKVYSLEIISRVTIMATRWHCNSSMMQNDIIVLCTMSLWFPYVIREGWKWFVFLEFCLFSWKILDRCTNTDTGNMKLIVSALISCRSNWTLDKIDTKSSFKEVPLQ